VDGNASAVTLNQGQEYQAIQYLAQLMMANLSNPTTVGEIQWAIWDLTAPGLINQNTGKETWGNLSSYLTAIDADIMAGINHDGGSGSQIVIYTPTSLGTCGQSYCGKPQEYIQVTPEPASLVLLGTGLLAVAGGLRKKKSLA
jgi:PEP-CTERM motif